MTVTSCSNRPPLLELEKSEFERRIGLGTELTATSNSGYSWIGIILYLINYTSFLQQERKRHVQTEKSGREK